MESEYKDILKKEIIQTLMSRDILVTENILKRIDNLDTVYDENILNELKKDKTLIVDDEFYSKISKDKSFSNDYEWNVTVLPENKDESNDYQGNNLINNNSEFDKNNKGSFESNDISNNTNGDYSSTGNNNMLNEKEDSVQILYNYTQISKKRSMNDFSFLFKKRYYSTLKILQGRKELSELVSISRLSGKNAKESVAFIGSVNEKSETANGNIILNIEDDTGFIKVIVTKNNNELFQTANDLVLDETIGITGMMGDNVVFANNIIFPDVPLSKELKKSPLDEYVLFISDLHFGSKYFLWKEWNKFLKWLNGDIGKESHKEIVKKIKYLVIGGDLVEGVGIYPGQENDLDVLSVYDQYKLFVNEIKKVSKDIKIIIIPGNHDAIRVADPQPPIPEKYVPELYEMENVYMLSSPSLVNIGRTKNFSGLDLLLYHGYSYTYYAETIPSIRDNGGMTRADLVLKFYLQRRHLGVTHGALQYVPETHDSLFIANVPDVLVTGHIHRTTADTYRNVTILNCSTWIGMTDFQEKVGLEPEPARAILMSMKTRQIKILNFSEKEKEEYSEKDSEKTYEENKNKKETNHEIENDTKKENENVKNDDKYSNNEIESDGVIENNKTVDLEAKNDLQKSNLDGKENLQDKINLNEQSNDFDLDEEYDDIDRMDAYDDYESDYNIDE